MSMVPESAPGLAITWAWQIIADHAEGRRPCGLPDCTRMQVAATCFEVTKDDYVPPSVRILMKSATPTPEQLREITGMGLPPTTPGLDQGVIHSHPSCPQAAAGWLRQPASPGQAPGVGVGRS
ncbi:hypothetical protein ACFP2T_26730 [Plantactinospora solaniradicis]|uniref:Uncharacterized protein n=1 Tax=Plantactinospora solaniradicis TaxID=1723736 RepID=A0ABW1KDC7_9ACTN